MPNQGKKSKTPTGPLPPPIDEVKWVRRSQIAAMVLFFVDIALVYVQDGFAYDFSKAVRTLFFAVLAFIAYMGISDPEGASSFNILTITRGRSAGVKAPGCTYVVIGWLFLIGAFFGYSWRFVRWLVATYGG